jgi:hypothetical protein
MSEFETDSYTEEPDCCGKEYGKHNCLNCGLERLCLRETNAELKQSLAESKKQNAEYLKVIKTLKPCFPRHINCAEDWMTCGIADECWNEQQREVDKA